MNGINKKKLLIIIFAGLVLAVGLILLTNRPEKVKYVTTGPEYIGAPLANFTGGKSVEFYEQQSDANYNAARDFIGDFLINSEKVEVKSGTKTTVRVEITDFESNYGDNSQYITDFTFKSLDSGKNYKARIINYLDGSQSSRFIVIDKNYEKTFGNL